MNCMRCGRENRGDEPFCADCLKSMEAYPVDPDIVLQLPRRNPAPVVRKPPRRSVPSLEERIALLSKRIRALTICVLVLLGICLALAYPALKELRDQYEIHWGKGQNYKHLIVATSEPFAETGPESTENN